MKQNKKRLTINLFYLVIISIVSMGTLGALLNNLNFGLDLQGGFEVLYKVESVDGKDVTSDMVTNTYKTIGKRIDTMGVSEPSIVVEGNDKIRVQLAGVTDPDVARNLIKKAANLTFRDTSDNLIMTSEVLKSGGAKVSADQYGKPAVALSVKDNEAFYKATKKISQNTDNRIVIWLDFDETSNFKTEQASCGTLSSSKCLSVAAVSQGFSSDVIIQGNFTDTEVKDLVDLINSGSLPTKLTEISSKTVGASFGADSLDKTFVAGVVGIVGIMIFMCAIYRFAGVISSIGLLIYTAITFLLFWVIGGVLTLPGIAAMVIGVGMAVDANVISFARMKDELYEGTKLPMAFQLGNKNAFRTIFDSNITTLIVAIILFVLGESSVKGFATMLIISIIATMFVMVFITRNLLNLFIKTNYFNNKLTTFIGIREKNVPSLEKNEKRTYKEFQKLNFTKHARLYFIISIIVMLVGIISLATNGLKLGIDFKGGSSITLESNKLITEDMLSTDLKSLHFKLEEIDVLSDHTISAKVEDTLTQKEINATEKYFSEKYEAKTDIGVVSNIVKQELIKNAILAVIIASIAIVIYVSLRFTFNFAVSGILALFHEVLIVFTLFSLFQLEVTSIFIAAILSIIGYSINDKIVTFDRIRENMNKKGHGKIKSKEELESIVNHSLRQTLTRSLMTIITTMIPVVSLIVLGSHEILNFNLALLFGLCIGVYSSLLIASQLWIVIEKRNIGKTLKKKWYEEEEIDEEIKIKGVNS